MPRVVFTPNLQRHVPSPAVEVSGDTVKAVLEAVFRDNPSLQSYILDDQERLREHVVIFINGAQIQDRTRLSDPVSRDAEVFVLQALSGGTEYTDGNRMPRRRGGGEKREQPIVCGYP